MIIKTRSILIFFSILFILGSFSSFPYLQYENNAVAQENKNEDEGQRRPHGGPPPEAKEACNGKNEGDSCGFTSPRVDEIKGDCMTVKNGEFACVPEGGHSGKKDQKPPEDDEPMGY